MLDSRRITAALFILTASLAGCAHAPAKGSAEELEVLTYDAEVVAQRLATADLSFPFELHNPTAAPARVDSVIWTLELLGEAPQQGRAEPNVQAVAGASQKGGFAITATTGTTPEDFTRRAAESALPFTLHAVFAVSTAAASDSYEAEWRGELFPPKRPEVSLTPHAARYGEMADLGFTLTIFNPNPFLVQLDGIDYAIVVDGTEILRGTLAEGQRLAAGTELQFELTRQLGRRDYQELGKRLQTGVRFPYRLDGTLRVAGLSLPVGIDGEIQFAR